MDSIGDDVNIDEIGDINWEEDNNDSEEAFEANYEVDDENEDGDWAGNPAVQNEANSIVSQHPFGVPSFMQTLDLEAMHAPEFSEYVNIGEGDVAVEDGKFSVGIEFGSRDSVIFAIKSYIISRGVDYTVYESEPQTFYAKCKGYGVGCDWLIRASLIRKKGCWEIKRYNGKYMCTMGTISQDHAMLDSDIIANAIRPLVEADPSIKVKSIIAEVQSRFNYTVSYPLSNGAWSPPRAWHMFCIRHIESNFLRRFKTSYLHKLVVNTGYSRMEQEYNKNYQRLKERVQQAQEMFEVREMQDGSIYTINLVQQHCDCGHFQVERLPCRHVLACCANQRLDWKVYVHDVYKMYEICKVYRGEFVPMGDPSTWDRYKGTNVIANWTLRRVTKGRLKSIRYLNEMDSRDMRGLRWCTICGREGHSRSRCPQRAGPNSNGGQ
ncbi:hypothetical protein Ahy_A03g013802 [Arachis hypogaea]|uniref:SWIM-type domain-containing protein n=1 Tax=Arachis hypogaea TaxID=3818 RepID=A0A445DWF4_ARAHY|nr:hypothetical protein Ahy_A03g013802 [Arachis hypogaea]